MKFSIYGRRHLTTLKQTILRWSSLRFRISFRLALLVGFLSLLLISGGTLGLYVIKQTETEFNHLFVHRMVPLGRLLAVQRNTQDIRSILLTAIIHGQQGDDTEPYLDQIHKRIKTINRQWELANLNSASSKEKALLANYKSARTTLGTEVVYPMMSAIRRKSFDEAIMIESASGNAYPQLESAVNNILQYELKTARSEIKDSINQDNTYTLLTITSIVGGTLIAIIFSLVIIRSVTIPIKRAVKLTNRVSRGDLTDVITATSNDEIGQLLAALSTMSLELRRIVSEVYTDVEAINEGSKNVAESNHELADKIEQQTVSLDITSSHMEDVVNTNKNTLEAATQAQQLAEAAHKVAEDGGNIITEAISAMNEIYSSSGKISEITTTIDSIAFQTNLLALNASVEAARAGEQGRGFSVVANEVRALSQRAATAAREIKTLIDSSVIKIKSGKELVDKSGKTLILIQDNSRSVSNIVEDINVAGKQLANGIDEINHAIAQMKSSSQQNASTVVTSAETSTDMAQRVEALIKLMAYFKIDGGMGRKDARAPAPSNLNLEFSNEPA